MMKIVISLFAASCLLISYGNANPVVTNNPVSPLPQNTPSPLPAGEVRMVKERLIFVSSDMNPEQVFHTLGLIRFYKQDGKAGRHTWVKYNLPGGHVLTLIYSATPGSSDEPNSLLLESANFDGVISQPKNSALSNQWPAESPN